MTIEQVAIICELLSHTTHFPHPMGKRRSQLFRGALLIQATDLAKTQDGKPIVIDADYVDKHLGDLVEDEDLSRYIL